MARAASVLVAGWVVVLALAGCNKPEANGDVEAPAGPPRVGVIDLDKAANDLGWMKDVQQNMNSLKMQFETDLKNAKETYLSQIRAKKTEFAPKETDKLTPSQQQILNQMAAVGNQSFGQLQQTAYQQLDNYRRQWIIEYRQAIGPVVRQVAEERKLWAVLEKAGPLMYSVGSSDVTDAVVDAARSHPPVLHPVPVPTLPNPGTITVNASATEPTTAPTTAPKEAGSSPDSH